MTHVAVIGGGWAGLAAAVRARSVGARVTLLEAAPTLGGRAREVRLNMGGRSLSLDNGQHLMIGAYETCLDLFRLVGAPMPAREPLHLRGTDGLELRCARLPAPWHLLVALARAGGLGWRDRFALVRAMTGLRLRGWRLGAGLTVAQWLRDAGQPAALIERWWSPLCIATLNTPVDAACANTFVAVLRDMLGASSRASDILTPSGTLGAQFPAPAARWLRAQGSAIHCGHRITGLQRDGHTWRLLGPQAPVLADRVIVATPLAVTGRLLASTGCGELAALATDLQNQATEPIATAWLAWPRETLALPSWAMLQEDPMQEAWGQWLFDRGEQAGWQLAAVVISACAHLRDADGNAPSLERIAQSVGRQVSQQCGVPRPLHARTVIERRATFRCTPDRPKASVNAGAGLWLAGDWLEPDYPACLEAAARSGWRAGEGAAHSGV